MRNTILFLLLMIAVVGGITLYANIAQPAVPVTPDSGFKVVEVAQGLEHPWAMAFLPDGRLLVTERPGRLRIISKNGQLKAPLGNVPAVYAEGQGGLLDVVLAPDFDTSKRIFFSFAEPQPEGKANTAVASARLNENELDDVNIIFHQNPAVEGGNHFGSRLAFASDGTLFIGLGERFDYSEKAQDKNVELGKIVHIHQDGSPVADNPFGSKVWSYGHRNIQGLAFDPHGALWEFEHGARGGDELNIITKGANYGWPVITYSHDYVTRLPLGEGTERSDVVPPLKQWTPSFAPSGMMFYSADKFPAWQGNLFVGALAHKHLKRLTLKGQKVVDEEILLEDRQQRIRDVRQGPDGFIYVLTDEDNGQILRLEPAL